MNPEQQRRDAELRQVVEGHEFAFDPVAWTEMEQLLDAAPGTGGAKGGTWQPGNTGWWIAGILLAGMAVAIAWWTTPKPDMETVTLNSFPMYETEAHTNRDTREVVVIPFLPPGQIQSPELPIELNRAIPPLEIKPRRASVQVLPPLETYLPGVRPLEARMDSLQGALPPLKRKRDRRTFFPDVIERY